MFDGTIAALWTTDGILLYTSFPYSFGRKPLLKLNPLSPLSNRSIYCSVAAAVCISRPTPCLVIFPDDCCEISSSCLPLREGAAPPMCPSRVQLLIFGNVWHPRILLPPTCLLACLPCCSVLCSPGVTWKRKLLQDDRLALSEIRNQTPQHLRPQC